jgi:tetratricopeptide (TPR) repeat protein
MTDERTRPIKIFYSYAHDDESSRVALDRHLMHSRIEGWHDRVIAPGREWKKEVDNNLDTADIILLLISSYFMASANCNEEMRRALQRRDREEAEVIPVLLRVVSDENLKDRSLTDLQILPTGRKAVTRWPDENEAFVDVAQGIWRVINNILKKRYLADAERAATKGDYGEASIIYEEFIKDFPDNDPLVYKLLADTLVQLGRFSKALHEIENAIYRNPYNASFYLSKARILVQQEQLNDAIDAYKKAKELNLLDPKLYEEMGDVLAKMKNYSEALEVYDKGIRLSAKDQQIHIKKSKMLNKLGKIEEAIATLDQAISAVSKNAQLHVNRGNLLAQSGKYKEALKDYDIAIHLEPDNIEFRRYKASMYRQLEQWKEAKDIYVQIFRYERDEKRNDYPYKPYLHKEYGDILFKLKQFSEAVTAYNKAIRLKSDFGQAYLGRAAAYEKLAEQDRTKAEELEEKN